MNLNKWKLGEPYVYLKPVEQTLYSAAVPIKQSQLVSAETKSHHFKTSCCPTKQNQIKSKEKPAQHPNLMAESET